MSKNQIITSYNSAFQPLFDDIKGKRPDLTNNSEVAKEALRDLWKKLECGLRDFAPQIYNYKDMQGI